MTFIELFVAALFKITAPVALILVLLTFPSSGHCAEPSVRHATQDGTYLFCTVPIEENR